MGYLNNSTITVDAILTKKGRELLARGQNEFQITQFALADDEVDYDLWNPAHPLGSDYYGIIIENMPLVEATSDESNIMRYKLLTLPKNTSRIPVISATETSILFQNPGASKDITPTTINFDAGNKTLGYTAVLGDSNVCAISVITPVTNGVTPTTPRYIGPNESATSITLTGFSFRLVAKQQLVSDVTTTLTIIGNETGGSITIPITVKKVSVATSGIGLTNA